MTLNRDEAVLIENIIKEGRFQFAIKCLHKVVKIKPKKNFAFSPRCIYSGLFIMYLMISGPIARSLKYILHLSKISKRDLINYCCYKMPSENNAAEFSYDYNHDIKCWISLYISLHSKLISILSSILEWIYISSNPIKKINCINRILQRMVKDYIHDPVKLAVVRKDMEFILMTAVCCHVRKVQISTNSKSDAPKTWTLPDKQNHRSFFCYELSMHVSEFAYENGQQSLFVFLPASLISDKWTIKKDTTHTDICDLIERLSTEEGICELRNLLDSETTSEGDVGLSTWPIFEVEKNLKIRQLLQALDAEQLLMPDEINLDNALENMYLKVHLGNVVHRARVKVTEDDIVAGAMTLIYTGQESSPSTRYVDVNYNFPFVWLIYEKLLREILFVGAFNNFAEPVSQIVGSNIN